MKIDLKTILLTLSMLLNVLGGTGTIPPVVGGAECPPGTSPVK
jgi:hypothetical protein